MPTELQEAMEETTLLVTDQDIIEPKIEWDRDNPNMSIGMIYPSMNDFRLAIMHHAIVHEFEVGTNKFDKIRFRGYWKAKGFQ